MKKIISTILLIVWLVIIFLFSSDDAVKSTNKSDNVVKSAIVLKDKITNTKTSKNKIKVLCKKYQKIVRKTAHFTEYLVLGILCIYCLSNYTHKRLIITSILFCILYAFSDEIHQMFISGRSGQIIDVLIDSSGAIIGIYLFSIIRNCRNKANEKCD